MLPIPKKINKNRVLYYIQSEKVRGLQPLNAMMEMTTIISNRKKSEACNPAVSLNRYSPIISNRKKSEACNPCVKGSATLLLYPIGKSQRPATTLRVNELDAHQSSFSAFLPS